MTPWEWQQEEVERFLAGLDSIRYEGWGPYAAKVNPIIARLVRFSGMAFPVIPAQTFAVGQAHLGGWILLDISTATRPTAQLAFWLAHEWGHEALGHQPNLYHPAGDPWRSRTTPSADEDAADEYAGRFVCAAGYDIDAVTAALRRLPEIHEDKAHSDGDKRAQHALKGYTDQGCSLGGQAISGPRCVTVQVPCQHPAHPLGHSVNCQHALHLHDGGMPCQHACPGPWGPVSCHTIDLAPCVHPQHPHDTAPCSHVAHPYGHQAQECE